MAGGVALNCVANGMLLHEKVFDGLWVQPASWDAGGALSISFSIVFQMERELERIFALSGFSNHELYATLCTVAAYKNMPHVMLLWERRKLHGLKDYTLNTHELLGLASNQPNELNSDAQDGSLFTAFIQKPGRNVLHLSFYVDNLFLSDPFDASFNVFFPYVPESDEDTENLVCISLGTFVFP